MTYRQNIRNPFELQSVLDQVKKALLDNKDVCINNVTDTTVSVTIFAKNIGDAERRKVLALQAAGELACTFQGFVPSITFHADGTIIVVEQDLNVTTHQEMTVHTLKGEK